MQRQITIKNFIDDYQKIIANNSPTIESDMKKFAADHNLNEITISPSMMNIIDKLLGTTEMTEQDFSSLRSELNAMKDNKYLHDFFIGFLRAASLAIINNNAPLVEESIKNIENAVNSNTPIPRDKNFSPKSFAYLNIYLLNKKPLELLPSKDVGSFYDAEHFPSMEYGWASNKKNIYDYHTFKDTMTFGINALRLVGKMPNTGNYCNLDLSKPLYPLLTDSNTKQRIDLPEENKKLNKQGVKDGDLYWPYKKVNKLAQGETGDNTYVATDGRKVLYIRGVNRYAPHGVLASKIATLVNPRYFSSERTLTKNVVASKRLDTYAVSIAELMTKRNDLLIKISEQATRENKIIAGIGTHDEVINFVNETDPNPENIGLSHEDPALAHVTKIDWDRCSPGSIKTLKEFEKLSSTFAISTLYGPETDKFAQHPTYIQERLTARLKLAMLPNELIKALADKSFIDIDHLDVEQKRKSIEGLTNTTVIALESLLSQTNIRHLASMLQSNPLLLNQLRGETQKYINEHFDEPLKTTILKAYDDKSQALSDQILQACKAQLKVKVEVKVMFDVNNPIHVQYAKDFLVKLEETLREISLIQNKSSSLKDSIKLIEKTLHEHAGNPALALNELYKSMGIPKKTVLSSLFKQTPDPINMNLVQAFKDINPPHQADSKNIKEQKVVIGAFKDSKSNGFLDKAQTEARVTREKTHSSNPPSQRL